MVTEATVDLMQLAGLKPYGSFVRVDQEDGSMARLPDLVAFGRQHRMPVLTIEDLCAISSIAVRTFSLSLIRNCNKPKFWLRFCANLIQGHSFLLKVCTESVQLKKMRVLTHLSVMRPIQTMIFCAIITPLAKRLAS